MAYDFDAVNDVLDFTAGGKETTIYTGAQFTTTNPMTLVCWARMDGSGNNIGSNGLPTAAMDLLTVQRTNDNSKVAIQLAGNLAGDPWRAVVSNTNSAFVGASVTAAAGLTSDRWYHITGVFRNATSRRCYVDGISGANNTTSAAAITACDWVLIGARRTTLAGGFASSQRWNGKIAETAVWTAELTEDEIMSLAKGACPTQVRPQSLEFYAPLVRGTQELMNDRSLSGVGVASFPTVFDHPRIFR